MWKQWIAVAEAVVVVAAVLVVVVFAAVVIGLSVVEAGRLAEIYSQTLSIEAYLAPAPAGFRAIGF